MIKLLISTLVIVLFFSHFIHLHNEKISQKKKIEKLLIELMIMLSIVFIFNKYTTENLLVALITILLVSYLINNDSYKLFQSLSKEHFQLLNTMVHPDNSPKFYEFDNLYPKKTKIKDPDFIVVEPEKPMNNFIEMSDELLLENEYNIVIPKTTKAAPTAAPTTVAPTTMAPTTMAPTTMAPQEIATQSIIPKENKEIFNDYTWYDKLIISLKNILF